MAVKVATIALLLTLTSNYVSAQPDSVYHVPTDSSSVSILIQQDPSPSGKNKIWPIAIAVGAILLSTYLIYNVRSR